MGELATGKQAVCGVAVVASASACESRTAECYLPPRRSVVCIPLVPAGALISLIVAFARSYAT